MVQRPLGLAALVDDGTSVSTIGGISRSTYTTLKGTVTASSGTLTLAKLDTLWINVIWRAKADRILYHGGRL